LHNSPAYHKAHLGKRGAFFFVAFLVPFAGSTNASSAHTPRPGSRQVFGARATCVLNARRLEMAGFVVFLNYFIRKGVSAVRDLLFPILLLIAVILLMFASIEKYDLLQEHIDLQKENSQLQREIRVLEIELENEEKGGSLE